MTGKVNTRKLAFWESLIDVDGEPTRYLEFGDKFTITANAIVYGGLFGDKEYYKVNHPTFGIGYVLVSGIEVT